MFVGYFAVGAMTVAAVALIWLCEHWQPQQPSSLETVHSQPVSSTPTSELLWHVLLALAAVILLGRLLATLFRFLAQPPVIGEVVAGILLGPSLLGQIAPDLAAYLLPQSAAPSLGVIAQLGIILYMFVVGLRLNTSFLREHIAATVLISHSSIVVPFLCGSALAIVCYPILAEPDVSLMLFALFFGTSMSVTAFPVLARILTDRGMQHTPLGVVALTCAAAGDVIAWCLLALVVGIAQASMESSLRVLAFAATYLLAMFLLGRPFIRRWARQFDDQPITANAQSLLFLALLGSSLTTEWIGIHAIFGAFVLGSVFPHDSVIAREVSDKLEGIVSVLLLPAFFAITGMRTELGLVSGLESWMWCLLITAVATLGKFGGTLFAARFTGFDWRDSASLGMLMNTRGLMELIVLNIGLELRIVSPTLFAMLVIMTLATTMATTPILNLIRVKR